jgi:hypothetical protein
MRLVSKEVFIPETNGRSIIPCFVTYVDAKEPVLMHRISWVDASDTYDDYEDMFSYDNGRTWTKPRLHLKSYEVPEGRMRYAESSAYFDADTGKVETMTSLVLYPKDRLDVDAVSYLRMQTYDPKSDRWSEESQTLLGHPEGVSTSFTFPIKTRRGRLLFPLCKPGVDASGKLRHYGDTTPPQFTAPNAALLLYEALEAIGEYGPDGRLTWRAGGLVKIDPQLSCRGLSENSVAELKDGRLVMVSRGSNVAYLDRPGYKWVCYSKDEGETWSAVEPLICSDGTPIESSATGGALFRSFTNEKLYWIGNFALNGERAQGNWPRSPLVIAEMQESPFALKRETITVIDRRGPGDSPKVQMSNFRYYQDRQTGEVVVFLARYAERDEVQWKLANYYRYRVEI